MTDTCDILAWPPPAPVAAELGRRLRLVARRMNGAIVRQGFPPAFLLALRQVLRGGGKLLGAKAAAGKPVAEGDQRLWSLPVILAQAAVAGTDHPGAPMAAWRDVASPGAAAEFLGVALDVIDDLQDGDSALVAEIGAPIALNVALALLGLAQAALADPQTPPALHTALSGIFARQLLAATGGQFLDLDYERRPRVTMDAAMDMTERKSGALVALTYQAGAVVGAAQGNRAASDSQAILADMGALGRALGVRMQLANDWRDAQLTADQTKSDRARHKQTPPLVMEAELRDAGLHDDTLLLPAVAQAMALAAGMQRDHARQALDRLVHEQHVSPRWLRWLVEG